MERIEKTVFLSYSRTNTPWALAIFQNLTQHGYDVFFDYDGIASGDFERVILANITARAHFLVLLTPSALERCGDPADWLRREIETALANHRNIVPLLLEGFDFGSFTIANQLKGDARCTQRMFPSCVRGGSIAEQNETPFDAIKLGSAADRSNNADGDPSKRGARLSGICRLLNIHTDVCVPTVSDEQ